MNVFMTGGLGFVGRHLCAALLQDGHRVTAVGRSRKPKVMIPHPSFHYFPADTTRTGDWQSQLPTSDMVINLAGKSIFTLWTEKAKQQIYESRIATTRNLVDGLASSGRPLFLSASAVGYYGDRGDDHLTEDEPAGQGFLAKVGRDWEFEARRAENRGARVVLTRFGIVLGKDGGAMAKMLPLYRMYMGGWLGDGRQWFPWIHIQDLVAALRFLIGQGAIAGPVNCCAPAPVRNKELAKTLGARLHRPVLLPLPAFAVKTLLGEFGAVLLQSQRAQPTVLVAAGFRFEYPEIGTAIAEIAG